MCLEKTKDMGGVFVNAYDELEMTSSAVFSMFSDFWAGDHYKNHFWSKEEVLNYWSEYADHYNVTKHIKFDANVSKVSDLGNSWKVVLFSGEAFQSKRLILAVGNNNIPSSPEWSHELTNVTQTHSKTYVNSSSYQGKRVFVVGGGESGSDIARQISAVAEECSVSLRDSTGWVVPSMLGGAAADTSTHRALWGLPRKYGSKLSASFLRARFKTI